MATYDIVIPHFGAGTLTDVCLACLQSIRQHSEDYRLIFVDNASPEFDHLSAELACHPVQLIRNTRNEGFIKAANQGLALATASYVVLLNNDTLAAAEWLRKLRKPLLRWKHVGLTGPRTTTPESWQGKWIVRGAANYLLAPGRMLAFFCVMIRRDVIARVGLLDESYGVGFGDDDEYCRRAEKAGYRLALVQDLVIPHHHRSTFRALYSDEEISRMQAAAMEKFRCQSV